MTVIIQRVGVNDVIDLRHEVLRHGLPRHTAQFDGDDVPDARHYAALIERRLVGCATLHPSRWDSRPAWQLRGMAVSSGERGRGIGRLLMHFMEKDLLDTPVLQLWCNARVPAIGFYQKLDWRVVSGVFEVPTAGPHVKMIRNLDGELRRNGESEQSPVR